MTGGRPLGALQPGDPEQIGSYLIRARVGAGGMGVVYLAEAPNGRPVAIKVIQSALAHDPVFRDRFRREVAAARRVRSRVTVTVLDADADSNNPWVAFEYVEGPNLQDVVEAGMPRLSASIGILSGIAEALVAIHQVGIIHRDLKPSNVLVPPDGVKVIDFGIAAALDATTTTRTGLMGTPAWLSPEQITGQPLTTAVDVFAWGCIALYTTTGRLAFSGGGDDSPPVLIYRVVNAEPDLGDIPEELFEPVSAALAKRPEDRPTVNEILRMMLPSRRPNSPLLGGMSQGPAGDSRDSQGQPGRPDPTPTAPGLPVAAGLGAAGWRVPGGAAPPAAAGDPSWPGVPVGQTPPGQTPPGQTPPGQPGPPTWPSAPGPGPSPGGAPTPGVGAWPGPPAGGPPAGVPTPGGPPPGVPPGPGPGAGPGGPSWPPSPPSHPSPAPTPPGGSPQGWSNPSMGTVPVAPGWAGGPPPQGPGGPGGPGWQPPPPPGWQTPPSPKKKGRLGLIIGIPVGVVALVVVIAIIAASSGSSKSTLTTTVPVTSTTTPPTSTSTPPTTTLSGVTPLAQLLPSDVDSFADCSHNNSPPANLTGLATALICSPKNLAGGQIFAFQFANAADYASSLATLNKFKGFDPSTAGSTCPPGADSQDSIGWHNTTYPSRAGQVLECLSVGTNNTQPDYIWTYPTENAIMDAQAAENSTFAALDTWWTKDAPPP